MGSNAWSGSRPSCIAYWRAASGWAVPAHHWPGVSPGAGTMGIHYVKGALVQAGTIDAARPQALVYERTAQGRLEPAAVEYVVLQAGWDAAHGAPPSLFGQQFMLTSGDNR